MLQLDQVQPVAGQYQEVDLVPATAVVAELEVGPGAERLGVGQLRLDGVQPGLFVVELRLGDRDPAAVLYRRVTPLSCAW